jgi:hypothetical protein
VSTVIAEGKALAVAAQRVAKVIDWAEVSPKVRDQLNRSIEQANLEAIQVCYGVCKAFVAKMIGAEPSSDQVDEYMAKAAADPAFPNRAYRLFGEAQKSASRRRRIFLASMLFGLPFSKMPDDERDRVDMAVERMTVEDAQLLKMIGEKRTSPTGVGKSKFGPCGLAVMTDAFRRGDQTTMRIVTPDPDGELESIRYPVDRAVFASLEVLGCVELDRQVEGVATEYLQHVFVTPLGEMVNRAIEEVRPGFAANL